MSIRTIKQTGQGFGDQEVTIVAKINGATVFSGAVPTLNQPVPALPNPDLQGVDLFTWEVPSDFQGTQTLEITVTGGTLVLMDTLANFVWKNNASGPPATIPGFASNFSEFYYFTYAGRPVADPFSDVTINDVAQTFSRDDDFDGQWFWPLPANAVFSCTVSFDAGVNVATWAADQAYAWGSWSIYQDQLYIVQNPDGSPVGVLPTNTAYWFPIPLPQWVQAQDYSNGACVYNGDLAYLSLQAVPGGTNIDNTAFWRNVPMAWKR